MTDEELQYLKHPLPQTPLEKEWMQLHDKYGHMSFRKMDQLVQNNMLPNKFKKLKGKHYMCPSCAYGRMRKRAWRSKGPKNLRNICKPAHNHPGAKVSVDQLVVAQPGLVPRLSGRHTHDRMCGATCFIDLFSKYSFSSLQTSLDREQTLAANAESCGVKIKSYRADNGRFAEKSFRDAGVGAQQVIDYCAVGAHHQNGVVERHFQSLSTKVRTILLHAKRHWPAMITITLWPFALKYTEMFHNHLNIDDNGLAPIQKFCNTTENIDLHDLHTWSCPCYILDKRMQSGTVMPKWGARSRLGIYLGHSPCHVGSPALVLNAKTLHISPQFHVVFDDNFTTIPYLLENEISPNWKELVEKAEL